MLFKPLQEKKGDFNATGDRYGHNDMRSFGMNQNDSSKDRKIARDLFGGIHIVEETTPKSNFESNRDSGLNPWTDPQGSTSKRVRFTAIQNKLLDPEENSMEDAVVSDFMDIESTDIPSYVDKENIHPNIMCHESRTNDSPFKLKRKEQLEMSSHKKIQVSEFSVKEEFARPARRKRSLIQMWKKGDPIFQGKFKTGATPKIQKEELINPILSRLTLKRANSDIPPTLENSLKAGDMIPDQNFGNNKFINHAKKTFGTPYPIKDQQPYSYNPNNHPTVRPFSIEEPIQQNITPANVDFGRFKTSNISKGTGQVNVNVKSTRNLSKPSAFAKNLFGDDLYGDASADMMGHSEISKKLFLIPETNGNSEFDLDQVSMAEEDVPSRVSAKKQQMEESFTRDDEFEEEAMGEPDNCAKRLFGDEDEEDCQTPSKRRSKMLSEDNELLQTANKMDAFGSISTDAFTSNHSSAEYASIGSFNKMHQMRGTSTPYSRFQADYEDLEVLGSGHFGTVYKCLNRIDGLIYAIKTIKYKKKGVSHISQALNEVQALASLSAMDDNPFIVRYYNVWMEEDMVYLVMEYCPSNLRNIEGLHIKFSESMIRQVLRDVCMGLKQLHKQKIVHLDIKPENILYSRTHKYKIADLGLSRIAERQAGEDINEGDSRYLAPELLNDYSENLPDLTKADIFSLGVTIYELMTGQTMPKNGPDWVAIRTGQLPRLENLKNFSNSLKSIIRLMLSPNPDQRPSAQELLDNSLQSDLELELRWEKTQNQLLKKKIKEYEEKLQIRRKNSF